MPTFDNAAADAEEARQALRGLAHATRSGDDPAQICSVLRSLTDAASSLEQALHQLAAFHDGPARPHLCGDDRAGRAASHQVSWELHRAAEILRHVATTIDHAHQIEATIAYTDPRPPRPLDAPRPAPVRGLSL